MLKAASPGPENAPAKTPLPTQQPKRLTHVTALANRQTRYVTGNSRRQTHGQKPKSLVQ